MNGKNRKKLSKIKSQCIKFASNFNRDCESFFNEISFVKSSSMNYFNTIHDLKIKSYDQFFEDANVSKNARKIYINYNISSFNFIFSKRKYLYIGSAKFDEDFKI